MSTDGVHASVKAIQDMEAACARFSRAVADRLPEIEKEIRQVTEGLDDRRSQLRREIADLEEQISSADEDDDKSSERQRAEDAEDVLASVSRRIRRLEDVAGSYTRHARNAENLTTDNATRMREFLSGAADELKSYLATQIESPASANSTHGVAAGANTSISGEAAETHSPNDQPFSSQLSAQEEELAARCGTEKMVVLNSEGHVVLQRDGDEESVAIYLNDEPLLFDAVLTHNHPKGLSFSAEDLSTAVSVDLKEIRAVGVAQPYTYSLKRPADGWPSKEEILRQREIASNQVYQDLIIQINRGELTTDEADQIFAHEIMLKLATSLNLPYERKKRTQPNEN